MFRIHYLAKPLVKTLESASRAKAALYIRLGVGSAYSLVYDQQRDAAWSQDTGRRVDDGIYGRRSGIGPKKAGEGVRQR